MLQLKYRTFDDLLNEVIADWHVYELEGMIEPAQLIKVALKINKLLGPKIHMDKECIIDVENFKGRLPNDFYNLNMALVCGEYTVTAPVMAGRFTENVIVNPDPTNPLITTVQSSCPDGNCANFQIVETVSYETRTYKTFQKLKIQNNTRVSSNCMNLRCNTAFQATLLENHLSTNFECAKVYMSYMGNLEDENHNLLVLDHDVINEWYELALKKKILENLMMNGEDVVNKLKYIKEELEPVRRNSLSIINTPDFAQMEEVYEMNREAMYQKYYRMFSSL